MKQVQLADGSAVPTLGLGTWKIGERASAKAAEVAALQRALASPRVQQVVAPTRRPLAPHPRLLNPVVDFDALPADADCNRHNKHQYEHPEKKSGYFFGFFILFFLPHKKDPCRVPIFCAASAD